MGAQMCHRGYIGLDWKGCVLGCIFSTLGLDEEDIDLSKHYRQPYWGTVFGFGWLTLTVGMILAQVRLLLQTLRQPLGN